MLGYLAGAWPRSHSNKGWEIRIAPIGALHLWAQVIEQQMVSPQQEVPPVGPGMQDAGPEARGQTGQTGQGEGDPAPSPTLRCPALHHTGTGAAQSSQGEGREAAVPLEGLSGTHKGPACQSQQAGGARDPASQQYISRSHQGRTGMSTERRGSSRGRGLTLAGHSKTAGEVAREAAPATSRQAPPAALEVNTEAQ